MQQNTQNQPKFYVGQKVVISQDKYNPKANSYTITEVTEKTISVSYQGTCGVHAAFGPYNLDGSDCAGLQFVPDPRVKQEPPEEQKEEPQMFYPEPGDTIVCRNGSEYTCVSKEDFDFERTPNCKDQAIFTDNSNEQGFMTWKDHSGKDGYRGNYDIVKIIPKSKPVQQDSVQVDEPAVYSVRQVLDSFFDVFPNFVVHDCEGKIKALNLHLAKINDPDVHTLICKNSRVLLRQSLKMATVPKTKLIQLAEEAGLVYNTELLQSKVHPWHRKALYKFYELIVKEMEKDVPVSVKYDYNVEKE